MATNRRKERRRKDLLEAGRSALKIQADASNKQQAVEFALEAARSQLTITDADLKAALQELNKGRQLIARLEREIAVLKAALTRVKRLARKQADQGKELKNQYQQATARIKTLQALDRDTKKLRRRLSESKKRERELKTRVSKIDGRQWVN